MRNFRNMIKSQKGQGAVEYALVLLAVVLILTAVLFTGGDTGLTGAITTAYSDAATAIGSASSGTPTS